MFHRLAVAGVVLVALLSGAAIGAAAEPKTIDIPAKDEFVVDLAAAMTPDDVAAVRALAKKLQADLAIPLCVMTVKTQAEYGTFKDIEAFARHILEHWIKGQPDRGWTSGALLLLATEDRKVRIQLGGSWRHTQDARTDAIMKETLIPRLKAKEFSKAMAEGATALEKVLRDNHKAASVEVEEKK